MSGLPIKNGAESGLVHNDVAVTGVAVDGRDGNWRRLVIGQPPHDELKSRRALQQFGHSFVDPGKGGVDSGARWAFDVGRNLVDAAYVQSRQRLADLVSHRCTQPGSVRA